jgi:Cu(I)/Ag(I) efflux system periplasmic protein CusF
MPPHFKAVAIIAVTLTAAPGAVAQVQPAPTAGSPQGMPAVAKPSGEWVQGEVRNVDKRAGKITLKHGDIKNLDMPGMTMVFKATDPAMLATVKIGDKVRFKAAMAGQVVVVTELAVVK